MYIRPYKEVAKDLATKDYNYWISRGEKRALKLFHVVAETVPAYKDFLKKSKLNHKKIKTIQEFKKFVPITNKKNYIEIYEREKISWPTKMYGGTVIYCSSGTTGKLTLWKRSVMHDKMAMLFHEIILNKNFNLKKNKTLILNCFAMGMHVAGYTTATAINGLLTKYPNVSLATPGSKKTEIINLVFSLINDFDQFLFFGYPPLVKDVIEDLLKNNFYKKEKIFSAILSGQGFSEQWREYFNKNISRKGNFVYSLYGSADGGAMGFETDLTISLRKRINSAPYKDFFKIRDFEKVTPHVFQYIPEFKYFEAVSEEILFTADNGVPLIRYNIQDIGGIVNYNQLNLLIPKNEEKYFRLPVLYIYGRKNNMIVFYGANIYPEHIQIILEKSAISKFLTENFIMEIKEDINFKNIFVLHVEFAKKNKSKISQESLKKSIVGELCNLNKEFSVVCNEMNKIDNVKIRFYDLGNNIFKKYNPKQKILRN